MLKKIVCVFFALVCTCFFWTQNAKPLFLDYSNEFELYLSSPSSTAKIVRADAKTYSLYTDVKGESCIICDRTIGVQEILDRFGASVVFTETIDGNLNVYAYSNQIAYRKNINGKIINLHISVAENYTAIGSPMIFGSF